MNFASSFRRLAPARPEKLKGFYSGSGGIAQGVHRVVLMGFATDSTSILKQNCEGKYPQTWHAHWTQESKQVKIVRPLKDKSTPTPLTLDIKHGSLFPRIGMNRVGYARPS